MCFSFVLCSFLRTFAVREFKIMVLELNETLIEGAERTVTMLAEEGQMVCLTGGTAACRADLLLAMMGLKMVKSGYVCIDGEPLSAEMADEFRALMAYAPDRLTAEGEVKRYEPPTVQEVFALKANRELPISNGILAEEMKRTGADGEKARLLAVAMLRQKPILLVDNPAPESAGYLRKLAQEEGKLVVATSAEQAIVEAAHIVVEL